MQPNIATNSRSASVPIANLPDANLLLATSPPHDLDTFGRMFSVLACGFVINLALTQSTIANTNFDRHLALPLAPYQDHQLGLSMTSSELEEPWIGKQLSDLMADAPDDVWAEIPSDLAARSDYYLYGRE